MSRPEFDPDAPYVDLEDMEHQTMCVLGYLGTDKPYIHDNNQ